MVRSETATIGKVSWSVRIARISGIPISVNAGLAVLAGLFVFVLATEGFPQVDPNASLRSRLIVAVVTVVALLGSILAHELGHATLARRQDVGVLGITLSLLGGYAQLDRQAPTPRAEFLIAAAGPVVNLIIGAIVGALTFSLHRLEAIDGIVLGALIWLAGVNIVLAVLNLFPAAPLDGGRVLTAALWKRLNDAELARILSARAGLVLGAVLTVVGVVQTTGSDWQGLVTIVIGVFLFVGARSEIGTAAIRRRLQRTTASELMVTDPPPVADSLTMAELDSFAGMDRSGVAFPVVRWSTDPIGYVVPSAAASLPTPDRSWTTVSQLMKASPTVARAWVNEPIDDVLGRLDRTEELLVVVHEPQAGNVVGTLSDSQVRPLFRSPDLWGRDRDG